MTQRIEKVERSGGEVVLGAERMPFTLWEASDPAPNVLCSYYTLGVGEKMAPHLHDALTEAWFLFTGSAQVDIGEQLIEMHAPSAVILPSGEPHSIKSLGPEPLLMAAFVTPRPGPGDTTVTGKL